MYTINQNKKFELMPTRHIKAYSSSCSQITLVYTSYVVASAWHSRKMQKKEQ